MATVGKIGQPFTSISGHTEHWRAIRKIWSQVLHYISGQSYKASTIVNYERKLFIRLATGHRTLCKSNKGLPGSMSSVDNLANQFMIVAYDSRVIIYDPRRYTRSIGHWCIVTYYCYFILSSHLMCRGLLNRYISK